MNTNLTLLNEEDFDKLPVNKKRIEIAKDVIARITAKNLIENRGNIIDTFSLPYDYDDYAPKDFFNNNGKCAVCARGALLCSWIGNFNKVKWKDISELFTGRIDYSSEGFPDQLLEVFGSEMLDNIEAAFEAQTFDWHYDRVETQKYVDAFATYDDIEDEWVGLSIIEIMEYIIANDGEFPLPD